MAIIADILTQVDAAATAVGATAFDAVAAEIVPVFRVGSVLVVALVPVVPLTGACIILALSLALLLTSFLRDIITLERGTSSRGDREPTRVGRTCSSHADLSDG